MSLSSFVAVLATAVVVSADSNSVAFPRERRQACCQAITLNCLACAAGMSPEAYCQQSPLPPIASNVCDCQQTGCASGYTCTVVQCLVPPCPYQCQQSASCANVRCQFGTCSMVNGRPVCPTGPTAQPSTAAPTTPAPTTLAPTTMAPTSFAPTTAMPVTLEPTTVAPTQQASPTSVAPTNSEAPTSDAPTTDAPTTVAPTTFAPVTAAPVTMAPVSIPTAPPSQGSPSTSSSDNTGDTLVYVLVVVIVIAALIGVYGMFVYSAKKKAVSAATTNVFAFGVDEAQPAPVNEYEDDAANGGGYLDVNTSK